MRLIIRADAGPEIGSGHVMRCLALAQELKHQGHGVVFMLKEYFDYMVDRLRSEGFLVELINAKDLLDDSRQVINYAKYNNVDWVVLDGYKFVKDYQSEVKRSGLKLLCIDDIAATEFLADIVVNQNSSAREADYSTRASRLLLGTYYVLLRDEYTKLRPVDHGKRPKKILINQGAGKVNPAHSVKLIKALEDGISDRIDIFVLAGMNNNGSGGRASSIKSKKHNIRLIGPDDFKAKLMCEADMALSAAGCTIWELSYFGVPTICFVMADNQAPIAGTLENKDCCMNVGWIKTADQEKLSNSIHKLYSDQRLRKKLSSNMKKMVDGKGRERVIDELMKIG